MAQRSVLLDCAGGLDELGAAAVHRVQPRELDVLWLVAAGETNHVIAVDLVIAQRR
jgi:hypothetical protein